MGNDGVTRTQGYHGGFLGALGGPFCN